MHTDSLIQMQLLILQQLYGMPIVYSRQHESFLIETKKGDKAIFYSLNSERGEAYFDLPPTDLIRPPILPATLTGGNTNKHGLNTSQTPFKHVPTTETNTAQTQQNTILTEKKAPDNTKQTTGITSRRKRKIAEYYQISNFANLYSGVIKDESNKIYSLVLEILANTKEQKTIDATLNDFETARKHAKSGQPTDINKLRQIRKKLETRRNRQRGISNGKEKMTKKRQFWLRFKIIAGVIVALVLVWLAKPKGNVTPEQQTVILTDSTINLFITEWEKQSGQKVYNWRRTKIVETLNGAELTPAEIKDTLNYLILKAWKKN